MICDAIGIQNTTFVASRLFADLVDGAFAARSELLLNGQRTSDRGRTLCRIFCVTDFVLRSRPPRSSPVGQC